MYLTKLLNAVCRVITSNRSSANLHSSGGSLYLDIDVYASKKLYVSFPIRRCNRRTYALPHGTLVLRTTENPGPVYTMESSCVLSLQLQPVEQGVAWQCGDSNYRDWGFTSLPYSHERSVLLTDGKFKRDIHFFQDKASHGYSCV